MARKTPRCEIVSWWAILSLAGALLLPDSGAGQETPPPRAPVAQFGEPVPIENAAAFASLVPPLPDVPGSRPTPVPGPAPAVAAPKKPSTVLVIPKPPPSLWDRLPPLPPPPRVGYFITGPTGPGFYSLRDVLLDHYWLKSPRVPYPPTASNPLAYFDANYCYLDDPRYQVDFDPFNRLKRTHPSPDWMFTAGGEERIRYMNEVDSRLTGDDNVYELNRFRLFGDLWYLDVFRLYAETIDSRIANNDLPPNKNDVDHFDILNLFADAKLFAWEDQPAYVRVGRQELYFGSQRLISFSDFPNVPRTFQGARTFWRGKDWDIDAFWVQPVLMYPTRLDPPDHNQSFAGVWLTRRPYQGQMIDLYYLDLENSNPVAVGQGGARAGYNVSTVGSRYAGDYRQKLLWDFEGMYQFGDWANQRIAAGSITTGLGYRFADVPTVPQFWLYWDHATGDPHPGSGDVHSTFNQLFPWGHQYFGYLDLVGRDNIDDISMQGVFYPLRWVSVQLQYHVFHLAQARDALYNASGVAIRQDPTGRAGTDVGDEIDYTTNFHLGPHQDIFVGFSHLFAGPFLRQTGPGGSPSVFYAQYLLRF